MVRQPMKPDTTLCRIEKVMMLVLIYGRSLDCRRLRERTAQHIPTEDGTYGSHT
jgi:hypothetical protein